MITAAHDPDPMKRLAAWLIDSTMTRHGLTEAEALLAIEESSIRLMVDPDGSYRASYRESICSQDDVMCYSASSQVTCDTA